VLHSVPTVEEAQTVSTLYCSLEDEVIRQRELLNNQLGDESIESLQTKVEALGEEKSIRSYPTILDELNAAKMDQAAVRMEITDHDKTIEKYQRIYSNRKGLLLQLALAVHNQQELFQNIGGLAALPDGVCDAASLIMAYESAQEEFRTEERKLDSMKERKAALEAKALETAAEELSGQLTEAREQVW
jgi:hypothetical protein